jgi:demethylmenaquinone methyltransferase/2-methoxy-6-polyprenyl-1,4-benzoquinol methylase
VSGEPTGGSGAMFDRIAERYDLLNRILSLGIDQRWRRRAISYIEPLDHARVADVATGTGDLAMLLASRGATVVGIDPSENMLAVARRKSAERSAGIDYRVGAADALGLDDESCDAVTIAFGIRNVPDRPKGLREMRRVLRPGGKLVVLELSEPRKGILAPAARFHIHRIVPEIGAFISGEREYRYLEKSIAAFPPPDEFASMVEAAGFRIESVESLTFGVAHLFVAERTERSSS